MKDELHHAWKGDKLTNYTSIHAYLRKYKKGICIFCGNVGKTHNALKKGKKHERKIENYHELCVKCHINYDRTEERELKWKENLSKSPSHQKVISEITCKNCRISFLPRRKETVYCSNKCSAIGRPYSSYKRNRNEKGVFINKA